MHPRLTACCLAGACFVVSAGYALCGLGTGESPEQRVEIIRTLLDNIPAAAQRPVFMSGMSSLDDLLDAIAEGVDLFDCALPVTLAAGGYALSFPLRPPSASSSASSASAPQPDPMHGTDDTKINLWSTSYRLDKGPLVPGCSCFACTRHSRAYVHHLLQTHEMLGDVLLETHNTHRLLAFFQAVREALAEGRFDEFRAWFKGLRHQPLDEAARGTGQAPAPKKRSAPDGSVDDAVAAARHEADDAHAEDAPQRKWSKPTPAAASS